LDKLGLVLYILAISTETPTCVEEKNESNLTTYTKKLDQSEINAGMSWLLMEYPAIVRIGIRSRTRSALDDDGDDDYDYDDDVGS
jgi:hypothetical protein